MVLKGCDLRIPGCEIRTLKTAGPGARRQASNGSSYIPQPDFWGARDTCPVSELIGSFKVASRPLSDALLGKGTAMESPSRASSVETLISFSLFPKNCMVALRESVTSLRLISVGHHKCTQNSMWPTETNCTAAAETCTKGQVMRA